MKRSCYSPICEFSIVCGGMARPKPVYYLARSPSVGNCEKDLTPNMLLSRRYQFLFVHIAKTGGTSVRNALQRYRWRDPYYVPLWIVGKLSDVARHSIGIKLP